MTSPWQANYLILKLRRELQPLIETIKITDVPSINSAGIGAYDYDPETNERVRQRRAEVASRLGLSMSDSRWHRDMHQRLAQAVASETNAAGQIFGKCAEMAALAAFTIENAVRQHQCNVYIFQIEELNHTLVLLTDSRYQSGQPVDWPREFHGNALIVDLWQATLTFNQGSAFLTELVCLAKDNPDARTRPRARVQAQIWAHAAASSLPTPRCAWPQQLLACLPRIRRR